MTHDIHYPKGQPMTTTPEPLLITKMTRIALQILSTAEPRSKVTSPAAELVLETISSASPKVRRELLDAHLEALEWLLADAFKSPTPTATFSTEPVPESVTDLEGIKAAGRAVLAQNRKMRAIIDLLPESLAHAWNHGWLCGAADSTPPDPNTEEFANLSNPYEPEKGDSTP